MGKNQHVVPRQDGWAVKGEGNKNDTSVHRTKQEATDAARQISRNQNSELFIHGKDGKIQRRDSHGNDPFPPRG